MYAECELQQRDENPGAVLAGRAVHERGGAQLGQDAKVISVDVHEQGPERHAGVPVVHVLARRGELVALELRDIEFWPNGTGQALIRRGKTDAEGQGRVAYLSRETVKWLKIWLEHAGIAEGPIFRRLIGRDEIGDALHPGSIAPIFKRVAQWIGMPARFVAEVSGHSTRVGAAQDLAELDIDLAAITQAGGWKSTRMPLQYAEKINAARSGMARAAAATGRDDADQMYK